jgi:hypothetical protein
MKVLGTRKAEELRKGLETLGFGVDWRVDGDLLRVSLSAPIGSWRQVTSDVVSSKHIAKLVEGRLEDLIELFDQDKILEQDRRNTRLLAFLRERVRDLQATIDLKLM